MQPRVVYETNILISGMSWGGKPSECIALAQQGAVEGLVLTHKDRLLRFGADLVFALCDIQGIEVVIIHQGERPSFEEELAQDVLEIITVFSARLYGSRSHKARKTIEALTEAHIANQPKQIELDINDGSLSTQDSNSSNENAEEGVE